MIEKFEENKLYKFNYEYFKANYIGILPIQIHDRWALKYDGKIITKILAEDEGEISIDGLNLSIAPNWCDEIIDVEYLSVDNELIHEGLQVLHTYNNGNPHLKGIVKRNIYGNLIIEPIQEWNKHRKQWEQSNNLFGSNHHLKKGNIYKILDNS